MRPARILAIAFAVTPALCGAGPVAAAPAGHAAEAARSAETARKAEVAARRMIVRYAGTYDVDALLKEPAVSGNAPHQGTEEEAVVCVDPYRSTIDAALFSQGTVTVFTRQAAYENLPICIKDWITQVNSGHTARLQRPRNVQLRVGQ